jgi:hypothetical protein
MMNHRIIDQSLKLRRRRRRRFDRGQALVESMMVFFIYFLLFAGGVKIFWAQWQRLRCMIHLFEVTQKKLVGQPVFSLTVRFEETQTSVKGRAVCGKALETVELPKLEAGRW